MKTSAFFSFLSAGLLGLAVWACNTIDPDTSFDPTPGSLKLVFENVVGAQKLQLNTGTYTNASGETFTPTTFNYFVSNLQLIRNDGSVYVVPQDSSYFLIKESVPTSQTITLKNVPAGSYTRLAFLIGVDSLRSTMGPDRLKGVLDPAGDHTSANGMYWAWNSGYIFMKLEGTSPSVPPNATGSTDFRYHIGLFGGKDTRTINNIKAVPISFGSDRATVTATKQPVVTLQTDVLKIFDGPATVSIAKNPAVMLTSYSAVVATNYQKMISYKGLITKGIK